MSQASPKAPKKSKPIFKRTPVIIALISGAAVILAAIITGIFALLATSRGVTSSPTPTPILTINSDPTPAPTATVTTASAPSSDVTPVNLTIPCISADCNYHPLQLTLTTITRDSTTNQTDLAFNVRDSCTSTGGTFFQTVELQDPTGNTYKGTVSDNSWSADTIIKVAVFANFTMQNNVEYLLNVGMFCSIYNDVFKAEFIKINK